ncbi:MAG: dihydropteroate synthase [Campylobacter sp.]
MKIFKINPDTDFDELCEVIQPSQVAIPLMKQKSSMNFYLLKDIRSPAANILKQDALSVGAELVTNKNTILNGENSTALLIATDNQVAKLAKKEAVQDFGLKDLSTFLKQNFNKPQKAQIMGVVNINEDSFNPDSRVNTKTGIEKIEKMIDQGADYIDLGAVSSRPGSVYVGSEIEFQRLRGIVAEIYRLNLHQMAIFSLDSFDEKCLKYALDHGFSLINDISADTNLAKLAKQYDATYSLMHMQNLPHNMQNNPKYDDLIFDIELFFREKIESIKSFGCEKIILDVGIGFGKTAEQNLFLIKNLEHFLSFGYPILTGASRKSVINFYSQSSVEQRLAGSLFLHLKAFENGSQIIRTHDVFEHVQMFRLNQAMQNLGVW